MRILCNLPLECFDDRASMRGIDLVNHRSAAYLAQSMLRSYTFGYGDPGAGGAVPYVVSQLTGNYRNIPSFLGGQHVIAAASDAEAYLDRLAAFATSLDEETVRVRHDFERGVVPPDFVLRTTLTQLDYYDGPIDGVYGPATVDAVKRLQADSGLRETGFVDQATSQAIDALLEQTVEPVYKERPFVGAGLRMQVSMEPSWLEPAWQMFVGCASNMDAYECVQLLTRQGSAGLQMKIGSSERADEIYLRGQAGLRFVHAPQPPRALPTAPGLVYLQVLRESQQEEWQNVQRSLTLAIRLNETRVAGNIQGQQVLTIRYGGQTTTLQFTLYVVKPEA